MCSGEGSGESTAAGNEVRGVDLDKAEGGRGMKMWCMRRNSEEGLWVGEDSYGNE